MERTQKSCLLRRTKLPLPQHRWKANRVGTSAATQENAPAYVNHPRTNTKTTHAPPADDVGCRATPNDLGSTVNAVQSDSKVSGMAPTHSGSPSVCATSANIFNLGLFVSKSERAGKGDHQRLGCFVTKVFTNYKKAIDALKYVGHDTLGVPILKEGFVDFVPVYDLAGKALANTILNSLRGHGFDLNLLCGQGYDGAASMSGHLSGAQAFFRQTAPKALKRASVETEFNRIFQKSVALLIITNVEMALPRITGRQMQRSNVPSATPEEYYRRNVHLPLLADFENQLRDQFNAHKKDVVGLNMLLPKFCGSASLSAIDDAV
ncbi:hypothetical protein HPB50_002712 [Hyalomma asiaticum]|uniref:Uncharacterized protein n=1 Tax=Hyalomma asiaticum TaxID=266040 RepID=A0ACB7TDT8_HYAAI|nr:hypothetical protein HPB50_002712 [Hyalomma asiaticum]